MNDFIAVYENAIDTGTCEEIIRRFEQSGDRYPGRAGTCFDKRTKDSTDLCISNLSEWQPISSHILHSIFKHLLSYVRKYSHLLYGDIGREFMDELGTKVVITPQFIETLPDNKLSELVTRSFRPTPVTILKYLKKCGGYHGWHSEIAPLRQDCEPLHRLLFYILYLNDVEEGGETEFYYYDRRVAPRRGRLVISPAGFTHTHKGNIPISCDKFIVASWISFQRHETIHRLLRS
jgi:hypothetical protein